MTTNGNSATALGHGYYFEDLSVGMEASYKKMITDKDILAFAELSGDVNPVHLSDDFAASTIFKRRIAHGFLTGSLFSTVLGTKLPGPGCIYLSQNMKFKAPVYIGDEGRSALRLDASYDLLLTQRLILQPKIETDFYSKRDAERGLGSGLSELAVALRLRYEIRREFAPYVGVEWARKFGETEDFARAAGKDAKETRFVAGLRFWF